MRDPGDTPPRREHINELRDEANLIRQRYGLLPVNFGPDIVAGDVVAASHLLAVRAAVDAFAQHVWPSDADPETALGVGQVIRAAHINELRDRLHALQGGASERWFYHLDALGSVRVVTGPTGGLIRRHEYGPFGEDLAPWAGADQRRFTGKERDPETGLDYFSARYYGAGIGRFTTVDPHNIVSEAEDEGDLVAYLSAPQRWNRYAYSLNNPLKFKDPDGRNPFAITALVGAGVYGGWRALQNALHDRPVMEGVAGEAAKGLVVGGTLGLAGPLLAQATVPLAGSQAALTARSVEGILRPGGELIGTRGTSNSIRLISGSVDDARALFDRLASGGTTVDAPTYSGILVRLPNGGTIGLRLTSKSGPPTIDINIAGIGIREIKFFE